MAIAHSIFAYMALVFLVPNVCPSFNRKLLNYYDNPPNSYYNPSYYNNPPPDTYYNNPPPDTYNNPPPDTYNNPPPPDTYNNPPPPSTYYNNKSQSGWISTIATFYGDKDGAGSLGGACGYEDAVVYQPFNSKIVALEPSLYQGGQGCGLCLLINCNYPSCTGVPVKVVATDECPEGACEPDHLFDLSGAAVRDLAKPNKEDELRTIGRMEVVYKVVPCDFRGVDLTFRVDQGSSNNYFATAVEFEDKGEILGVNVRDAIMKGYIPMTHSWGAVFMVVFNHSFVAPLSFQVSDAKQTVVAKNVIPVNYQTDKEYVSTVNFDS